MNWEAFSALGVFSAGHWRDIISHWSYIMSAVGDIMNCVGDIMNCVEDIMICVGGSEKRIKNS